MTAFLTRTVRFAAAHRYHRPEWSEERNREVFGACANPHGHGHNYLLEVTVAGVPDPDTGFSVDLGALDRLLREEVVAPLDHHARGRGPVGGLLRARTGAGAAPSRLDVGGSAQLQSAERWNCRAASRLFGSSPMSAPSAVGVATAQ
jgi:hypothetical protein